MYTCVRMLALIECILKYNSLYIYDVSNDNI